MQILVYHKYLLGSTWYTLDTRPKMSDNITTIKIDKTVKDKLDKLKKYRRETYSDIIDRLVNSNDIKIDKPLY